MKNNIIGIIVKIFFGILSLIIVFKLLALIYNILVNYFIPGIIYLILGMVVMSVVGIGFASLPSQFADEVDPRKKAERERRNDKFKF